MAGGREGSGRHFRPTVAKLDKEGTWPKELAGLRLRLIKASTPHVQTSDDSQWNPAQLNSATLIFADERGSASCRTKVYPFRTDTAMYEQPYWSGTSW